MVNFGVQMSSFQAVVTFTNALINKSKVKIIQWLFAVVNSVSAEVLNTISIHQTMLLYAFLGSFYSKCSTKTYNVLQSQASCKKATEMYLYFSLR